MLTPSVTHIANEEAATRKPAELYRIWRPGATGTTEWCYTSGDVTVTHDSKSYVPAPITRGQITQDADLKVTQVSVTVDFLSPAFTAFMVNWPVELVWVEIKKTFRNNPGEGQVIFLGQVSQVSIQGRKAQALCVGFEYFLKQKMPIVRYQLQCNWRLRYGQCGYNPDIYKVDAVITVDWDPTHLVSDTFAGYPEHYFMWGWVKWGDYRRPVTYSTPTTKVVVMRYPIPGLTTGQTVTVYAGCDRSMDSCKNRFNNIMNFGGFPYIPFNNPVTKLPAPTQPNARGKK